MTDKCEQRDLSTGKKLGHRFDYFTTQNCVCKRCGHEIPPLTNVREKKHGDKHNFRRSDPRWQA